LFEYLIENDISPQVHYIPVHLQPYYRRQFNYQSGDLPAAEKYYSEALSLPMFPTLEEEEIEYVINTVGGFYS
jgi:hypothetical protein